MGVLGTGHWAVWCHGTVLTERSDVELVGYWGRDRSRAEAAAAATSGRAFDDLDDLLAHVDAVSVALPPDVQATVAARAARAGRHVLLDKPLALGLPGADEVASAVRDAGVVTVSFMTLLFQADVRAWLAEAARLADEHGPWEGALVHCSGSIDLPDSPYAGSVWRRERGGLWDWGPHALSLVKELLPPPERVVASTGARDTVTLGLEHTDGAGSVLVLTVTAPPRAVGARAVVWGPAGRHELVLPADTLRESYGRAVDEFRTCVRTGRRHRLDAAYGRDVVAVLDAAQRHLELPTATRTTAVVPAVPATVPT
ncbi:Gfo/Idh/MocA family protein [Pseudonocardia alni]|uniref:Gfo/Idh/MocA family protein n=1 Tax=Pseudonocardia alni TaxID=33907 RepID=UPI0033F113EA